MKIKTSILVIILCLQFAACSDSALYLVNSIARLGDFTVTEDIVYGPHSQNKLDLYKPVDKEKGTVIFFYGGCWGGCETLPKDNYRFVAQTLTDLGYAVVIPDYRLYPKVKFLSIMDDAKLVFQWVSQNHRNYGIQSDSIILMGHSAGAHIAAMLASNEHYLGDNLYKRLLAFIGLAGPYDFPLDQNYQFELFSEIDYEQSQPSTFVDGTEVPMLLLHGTEDNKVYLRNLVNMRKAIENKNGIVKTKIYDDVNHTQIIAALSMPLRNRYPVVDDMAAFLMQL